MSIEDMTLRDIRERLNAGARFTAEARGMAFVAVKVAGTHQQYTVSAVPNGEPEQETGATAAGVEGLISLMRQNVALSEWVLEG
jgi:hypothetical protein